MQLQETGKRYYVTVDAGSASVSFASTLSRWGDGADGEPVAFFDNGIAICGGDLDMEELPPVLDYAASPPDPIVIVVFNKEAPTPQRERFTVTDLDFDENRAVLAKNIRTLRQKANMTQEDLGRALHVSQSLVYNWEHGIGYPRPDRMVAMARMFGVTVSALMGEND